MPPTALLLLNPGARKGAVSPSDAADALRARGLDVIFEPLDDPGRAHALIHRHATAIDRVIVGGGDGTLSAVTRALIDTDLPLGILPLGTANNVARTLDIPVGLEAAFDLAAGEARRRIDVGEVNGHCFLTTASFGLSVAITESLSHKAKQRWGALAYALTATRVLARARAVHAHIRWDGGELHTRTVQVVVGNGRYYGSALQVAEDAAIDDHALDLYSIELRRWWQLLSLAVALKRGSHGKRRAVQTARARGFEVTTSIPCPIDADGELATETPATFRLLPAAIAVLAGGVSSKG